MVTPLTIIGAAACCYAATEAGIYMTTKREVELPKRHENDAKFTLHGSYLDYLFRDPCQTCSAQENSQSLSSRCEILDMKYSVHHDCKGHEKHKFYYDDDRMPEDPKERYYKVDGSPYTTEGLTSKLAAFAHILFNDFTGAFSETSIEDLQDDQFPVQSRVEDPYYPMARCSPPVRRRAFKPDFEEPKTKAYSEKVVMQQKAYEEALAKRREKKFRWFGLV